jgi:hypothetical protein
MAINLQIQSRGETTMKTANTENNTIMNTDMRELTLDELNELPGASGDNAKLIIAGEVGGLMVGLDFALSPLADAVKSVASKYGN